jgi:cyclopropane fatty-acyl-phospholipid synthase-like methyltransferase
MDLTIFWWEWLIILFVILFCIFFATTLWGVIFYSSPFVPSSFAKAKKMIELAELKNGEKVVDLGCGDGRILRLVAEKISSQKIIGYEIVSSVVWWARFLNLISGHREIKISRENFLQQNLTEFEVIFMFLVGSTMDEFHEKHWHKLKKGTRIISQTFVFSQEKPDKIIEFSQSKFFVYYKK